MKNHSPPQWPVVKYDVKLPEAIAQRFQALRMKLCDEAGLDHDDHPDLHYNSLVCQAIDAFCDLLEKEDVT